MYNLLNDNIEYTSPVAVLGTCMMYDVPVHGIDAVHTCQATVVASAVVGTLFFEFTAQRKIIFCAKPKTTFYNVEATVAANECSGSSCCSTLVGTKHRTRKGDANPESCAAGSLATSSTEAFSPSTHSDWSFLNNAG